MGNKGSSAVSETESININESTINMVSKAINKCVVSISQSQMINLKSKGSISISNSDFTQNASINSECLLQAERQADIKREFVNDIMNQIVTKNKKLIGIMGGGSKSLTRSRIENRLNTSINNLDMQESINKVVNSINLKSVSLEGNIVIEGVTLSQGAKIYAKSILQTRQFTTIVEELNNLIDNDITTESTDAVAELAGFMSDGGMLKLIAVGGVMFLLILIVIIVMVVVIKSGSSGSSGPGGLPGGLTVNVGGPQASTN